MSSSVISSPWAVSESCMLKMSESESLSVRSACFAAWFLKCALRVPMVPESFFAEPLASKTSSLMDIVKVPAACNSSLSFKSNVNEQSISSIVTSWLLFVMFNTSPICISSFSTNLKAPPGFMLSARISAFNRASSASPSFCAFADKLITSPPEADASNEKTKLPSSGFLASSFTETFMSSPFKLIASSIPNSAPSPCTPRLIPCLSSPV
mmetsp:Transcript_47493/g.132421  ORF Transcript_47493/g.132421 Transcript_47493/m.132421 type:complete len:210 (+) Transcript_47493:1949-2578(+)